MRLAILFFLSIFLSFFCGNDPEPQKEDNCMTAQVDGEEFTAESTIVIVAATGAINVEEATGDKIKGTFSF